jgi:hypothetical protein
MLFGKKSWQKAIYWPCQGMRRDAKGRQTLDKSERAAAVIQGQIQAGIGGSDRAKQA